MMVTSSVPARVLLFSCLVLVQAFVLSWCSLMAESKPIEAPAPQKSQKKAGPASLRRADFVMEGVSCLGCIRRIERKLRQTEGVFKADVDINTPHRVAVFYDESKTNPEKFWAPYIPEHVSMTKLKVSKATEVPKNDLYYTPLPPVKADPDTFGVPDIPVPGVH